MSERDLCPPYFFKRIRQEALVNFIEPVCDVDLSLVRAKTLVTQIFRLVVYIVFSAHDHLSDSE